MKKITRFARRPLAGLILLGSTTLVATSAYASNPVSWEDIANDANTPKDVLGYGIGPKAQRYSPMTEINAENVHMLTPTWSFSFGDEKQRGQETQALVHEGVIYVTGSYSRVFAVDARTGKKLWSYAHRLPEDIRPCCDVVNRGAYFW